MNHDNRDLVPFCNLRDFPGLVKQPCFKIYVIHIQRMKLDNRDLMPFCNLCDIPRLVRILISANAQMSSAFCLQVFVIQVFCAPLRFDFPIGMESASMLEVFAQAYRVWPCRVWRLVLESILASAKGISACCLQFFSWAAKMTSQSHGEFKIVFAPQFNRCPRWLELFWRKRLEQTWHERQEQACRQSVLLQAQKFGLQSDQDVVNEPCLCTDESCCQGTERRDACCSEEMRLLLKAHCVPWCWPWRLCHRLAGVLWQEKS